jgi:GNAT superfamily N-acetyltransferase
VHIAAIRRACRSHYRPEQIDAWAGAKTLDLYTRAMRDAIVFVAEEGGEVIGFCELDPGESMIRMLYADPARQGRGIGRKLLRRMEEAGREVGLTRITLNSTLNAVPFYRRAGYHAGQMRHFDLGNGVSMTCLRMWKDLRR